MPRIREASADERLVQRRALAGLLWSKQSYLFDVARWLDGDDPAQPPPPSPFAWGRRERLAELLGDSFDLEIEEGTNHFRYGSGEQAWNLWANHYGPSRTLAGNLDDARREEFKRAMIAWHETFPSPLGFDQPRQYLITRGVRR